MIRRLFHTKDSAPAWALISQIEHARLAGDLATHWGVAPFAPVSPPKEVVDAIYHHDDGWSDWETAPQVDSQMGCPYDFTEMPTEDALRIWSQSIELARQRSRLSAWMVAEHFLALLRHSSSHTSPSARSWIVTIEAASLTWLAEWQAIDRANHTQAMADRSLRYLKMFDALSLWFCCASRSEPHSVAGPIGPAVSFCPAGPDQVVVSPWPFSVDQVDLSVSAPVVPVDRYPSRAALAQAPHEPTLLGWRLRPE